MGGKELSSDKALTARAQAAVQSLLDGRPRLLPVTHARYGEWKPTVMLLAGVYVLEGRKGAALVYKHLVKRDEAVQALQALKAGEAGEALQAGEAGRACADTMRPAPARDTDGACQRGACQRGACQQGAVEAWDVIPRVLPVGVTLLHGPQRAGKTEAVLQWAVAAAKAGEPDPRGVRYVGYGKGAAQTERRLRLLGAGTQRRTRLPLHVGEEWPLLEETGVERLMDDLVDHRLVIIDGLAAALGAQGRAPGDPQRPTLEQVVERLGRLHVMAMATQAAIVLVYEGQHPPCEDEYRDLENVDEVEDVVGAGLVLAHTWGQIARSYGMVRRARGGVMHRVGAQA